MSDWMDKLTPDEVRQWNEIVKHIHDVTVPGMEGSAFVMSLVPEDGKPDIKFAVELGLDPSPSGETCASSTSS